MLRFGRLLSQARGWLCRYSYRTDILKGDRQKKFVWSEEAESFERLKAALISLHPS